MKDSEPKLIGLDWGTTSCRAYQIGADGAVLDSISADTGIMAIDDGDFEGAFERIVAPWITPAGLPPVIASGMITSRNGWLETPYLPAPASAEDFANSLRSTVTANGHRLHFITGVSAEDAAGAPDVMRGEETEILGHAHHSANNSQLYVVPGTHSKWVQVFDGKLQHFATYMTGEIFAVVKAHSILSKLTADGPFVEKSFHQGVKIGLHHRGELLHHLFAARTLPLFDKQTPVEASNFLSGLLIGCEVSAGLAAFDHGTSVTVIGRDELSARYQHVLSKAGVPADRVQQSSVTRGHFLIAGLAGLIE